MGGLKIAEPKIEIPKIPEGMKDFHPIEMPVFTVAPDGKVKGILKPAEEPTLQIVPDISNALPVKFSKGLQTRSHPPIVQKLAVATVLLAGAATLISHQELANWIVDRFKGFAPLFTLGLFPLFGMVMGGGKGGGKKDDPSENLLGLEEPFREITGSSGMIAGDENGSASSRPIDGSAEPSLPSAFQRFSKYSDYAAAVDALEFYRGTPKTLSFVGMTGGRKTGRDDEIYKDEMITQGTVLRGRSRISMEVSTGAYKIETLPESSPSPGAEDLKVYSYGADGPEEVVGYEFFATTRGSDSGTLYLKTRDRDVVEALHTQVVSEIEKTGSVAAALDWLVNRSPFPVDLFEISDADREEWSRRALEQSRYFSDPVEFESALATLKGKSGLFPTLIFFDEEVGARVHHLVSRGEVSQDGSLIPMEVTTQLDMRRKGSASTTVYVLTARQGRESIQVVINTANPEWAEIIHRQFVEKLKALGSIDKTLNWMIFAGPFSRVLYLNWLRDWG